MASKNLSPPAATGGAPNLFLRGGLNSSDVTKSALKNQVKSRGGKRSREKGNRLERALVRALQDHGFAAERVPLSGAAGGSYTGDLTVPVLGIDRCVEVKSRARGFGQLYNWLEERDVLIVKGDRKTPLVVIRLDFAARIAMAAEGNKGDAK